MLKKIITTLLVLFICIVSVPGKSKHETSRMVLISGGFYTPLYKSAGDTSEKVEPFFMDVYPVTNGEFLAFLKANPAWQRSNVKKIFADASYLQHWDSDLELGKNVDPNSPVTNISWFAAKAYAQWCGKRLPSVAEWEYAASASKNSPNAGNDAANIKRILEWYSKKSPKQLPAIGTTEKNYWGVSDLFGLVWEWTYDFNSTLSGGDSNSENNLFCGSSGLNANNTKDYPAFMRYGFRSSLKANYSVNNLGFRCVKDIN